MLFSRVGVNFICSLNAQGSPQGGIGSVIGMVLLAIFVLVLLLGSCIFLLRTNDSYGFSPHFFLQM